MEEDQFGVYVNNYVCTPEEWHRALSSPPDALPVLDEWQRERARSFGISEEEYSRGVLARHLAEERMRERGQILGKQVQAALRGLGERYRLIGVLAELNKNGWTIRIESAERVVDIHIEPRLGDDIINSLDGRKQEELRIRLLSGLGLDELVVKR